MIDALRAWGASSPGPLSEIEDWDDVMKALENREDIT